MKKILRRFALHRGLLGLVFILSCFGVQAQNGTEITLTDLSAFEDPGESWSIAGGVRASLEKNNDLKVDKGTGILVNNPKKEHAGTDLFTRFEHGDIDLELDYMMPKGSNSGIYLQGRYELQLLDSWTVKNPTPGDNGGIYERWDESRPEGKKGYQGYAPRQGVSRAPGLWQHLKISFQAPRFNADGQKIENAKMLRVELNGVTIHENVELLGPTRGSIGEDEAAMGPLRFQGDHGALAIRNIKLTRYDSPPPSLKNLRFKVFGAEGDFEALPNPDTLSVAKQGRSDVLSAQLAGLPSQFLMQYSGKLTVQEAGEYRFYLGTAGGSGLLRIDGEEVLPFQEESEDTVKLSKGDVSFELMYAKSEGQEEPLLGLSVSSQGLRQHWLSDITAAGSYVVDPIYVNANEKPLVRSFRDLPGGPRLTHAVSVSSLDQVHYTYDMNHGNLVQVWRGGFLNATPMWHQRGDGSTLPNGSVENLVNTPSLALNKLENEEAAWSNDTTGTGFRPKGYLLENDNPIFLYKVYGMQVEDKIRVIEDGKGVQRTLTLEGQEPSDQLYYRLASGKSINEVGKNRYMVDGHSYYIQIGDSGKSRARVRTVEGHQELILPAASTLNYTILF